MVTQFLVRLETFIKEYQLLKKGDKVLIGFSGGADSTALIESLLLLKNKLSVSLYAAHINHNLRGEDSKADLLYVKNYCSKNSIPLEIKEAYFFDKTNLEDKARRIRLDFFKSVSDSLNINRIALGHNKEDAVETLLLHLLRGSGITGMKGILPKNGNIIRPLLGFNRSEIESFLLQSGIKQWRIDKSNYENHYTRNKVRNIILPVIMKEVNPNIVQTLYNSCKVFQHNDEYLQQQAEVAYSKAVVSESEKKITLNIPFLKKEHPIIVYYLIKMGIAKLSPIDNSLSHIQFESIMLLFESEGSKFIKLNSIEFRKEYELLSILPTNEVDKMEDELPLSVDISKDTYLFFQDYKLSFRIINKSADNRIISNKNTAMIDIDKIKLPLSIHTKNTGDSFIPLGMKGKKKIKDYFIDEKISKYERNSTMIVKDKDKIVWVVGYQIDDRVKIDDQTKRILLIEKNIVGEDKNDS